MPHKKSTIVLVIVFLLFILLLPSCAEGQTDPPTVEQIQQEGEWVTDTRPDGIEVYCFYFAAGTDNTNNSKSWLVYTCSPIDDSSNDITIENN